MDKSCAAIYRNLIHMNDKKKSSSYGTLYLREFFETSTCDQWFNFEPLRQDYIEQIGVKTVQRLQQYQETSEDEKIIDQAVAHFASRDQSVLLRTLSVKEWIARQLYLTGQTGNGHALSRRTLDNLRNRRG